MSEMIERVACVIATELGDDFDLAIADRGAWRKSQGIKDGRYRDINEPTQADFLELARAAIQAMREPTERMLHAGCLAANKDTLEDWQAMIDEALR